MLPTSIYPFAAAVALSAGSLFVLDSSALGQAASPLISVFTSIGPNGNSTAPGNSTYTTNALNAIGSRGFTSPGSMGTGPGAYSYVTTAGTNQVLTTDFNSYRGVADSGPITNYYGAAYSGEFGSMLYFGLDVRNSTGNSVDRFSLSQLSFASYDINDPSNPNSPIYTVGAGSFHLSSGAFRLYDLQAGNYVDVTSMSTDTSLVDRIVYRGAAVSFDSLASDGPNDQSALNNDITQLNTYDAPNGAPDLKGQYSLNGGTGFATLQLTPSALVPEPSSVLISIFGGLGLVAACRKKFTKRSA